MATTENVRLRPSETSKNEVKNNNNNKGRRQRQKSTMARRGLRSLAVAIAVPVSLHLLTFLLGQPTRGPWLWALHAMSVGSASLMGLCAWLVWAEGGFHQRPVALGMFTGYLALSLAWGPIVFGLGWIWAGLVVSAIMFGALAGCCRVFKGINPIAGDLAKLCLIWAGIVVSVNVKFLYW